jgi:hypothetical protein
MPQVGRIKEDVINRAFLDLNVRQCREFGMVFGPIDSQRNAITVSLPDTGISSSIKV